MKNLIPIKEFMRLSQLAAKDIIEMLDNGEIPFEAGPMSELLVDIDTVKIETIAFRKRKQEEISMSDESILLEELIATEIVRNLDGMLEDAMSLAVRWNNSKNSDIS